jgi:hypothetical protein
MVNQKIEGIIIIQLVAIRQIIFRKIINLLLILMFY